MKIQCASRTLDLSSPKVMGILNVTPDSFYDGGRHFTGREGFSLDSALRSAEQLVEQGADILDIGGESTRPGATPVSIQEECDRVLPVLEALASRLDVVLSVDTSTPQLMQQAAHLGAGMINDVRALERPGAIQAARQTGLPVCLMHMQGNPGTMQDNPRYSEVVSEVDTYLLARIEAFAGQDATLKSRIILDPGIGFGKTDPDNLALINQLDKIGNAAYPLLVGISRKSMIGRLLGREPAQRLAGSLGFALAALHRGASILRVHDVAETRDIVEVFNLTRFGTNP